MPACSQQLNSLSNVSLLLPSQTVKLANSAVSGIDGLVADVSSSVAAVKRDAGSSSKAAGLAIDSMVTRAIEKGQVVKETLAGERHPLL